METAPVAYSLVLGLDVDTATRIHGRARPGSRQPKEAVGAAE